MAQADLGVRLEKRIRATPAKIWGIVGTEEGMKRWLGPVRFEPRRGGKVLFDCDEGEGRRNLIFGEVRDLQEAQRISFTWQEFSCGTLRCMPRPTLVTIALEQEGAETVTTLTHSGFEALPDGPVQRKQYEEGWRDLDDLERLKRMCEAQQRGTA